MKTIFIDSQLVSKIIEAHDLGIIGNAIDAHILKELKPEYLSNLKCSEETINFLDKFLSDVKKFKRTGYGSLYAAEFCNII